MSAPPVVTIFLSSPRDVTPEREAACRAIARVGGIYEKYVAFHVERWEAKFYEATRSFQEGIAAMSTFDLVIGILWKRIGTELPPEKFRRADGSAFESGTVYEIESAIEAYQAKRRGPSVFVFKKTAPIFYSESGVEEERQQKDTLDAWWARKFQDGGGHYIAGANSFVTVEGFETLLEDLLVHWLQSNGYAPTGPIWDSQKLGSPYPGLIAYDHDREQVYFGRTYAIEEAREQVVTHLDKPNCWPVLFVIGASGAGKSSLVRAGLIPRLIRPGTGPRVDVWRTVATEPSTQCTQTLATALYASLPELQLSAQGTAMRWAKLAKASPEAAADSVTWALNAIAEAEQQRTGLGNPVRACLMLLIDQLEGIFGNAEQAVYSQLLESLIASQLVWLVVTLRSDRYAELQQDPHLLKLKRSGVTYDLPPPGPTEINDIIKGPARAAGLVFSEHDGISLAETLKLVTPNADALPLLQMTLAQLFEMKDGNTLSHSAYIKIGGIEGAIAAHANAIFSKMPASSQRELDTVLRELVRDVSRRPDGTIRFTAQRVQKSQLTKSASRLNLIERFVDGRLLVSDGETIRVAHEALLRRWEPATEVLGRMADAEIRKARFRLLFAASVAGLFFCITAAALFSYERSNWNLALALRARAEQFIANDMPSRALLLAADASQDPLSGLRNILFKSAHEDSTRLKSIVQIARPAASTPETLLQDSAAATSVDSSEDGKRIVIGYSSGDIRLLEENGTITNLPLNKGRILSVKFAPDSLVAFIATDNTIYRWKQDTQELTPLCTGNVTITSMTVSREARILVWTSKDKSTNVLDLRTGTNRRFEDHKNWVLAAAVSRDGRRIASAGDDGRIVVRDTQGDSKILSFDAGHKDIWSLSLSPDGSYLATASISGVVALWRADGRQSNPIPRELQMIADRRWKVTFSPDGSSVAVTSWAGTVTLFDAADARHLGTIDGNDQLVNEVVFLPHTGKLVSASNSGAVKRWNLSEIKPMFLTKQTEASEIIVASYNSDGSTFVAGGDDGIARMYDVDRDGNLLPRCNVTTQGWIIGLAFVQRPNRVIAVSASQGGSNSRPMISTFDTAHCRIEQLKNLPSTGDITSIAASPSSGMLALGMQGGDILLYDAEKQGPPDKVQLPISGSVTDVAFDDHGKRLVAALDQGKVYLIDVSLKEHRELIGPTQYVSTVKFAPNSRFVAAGGRDEDIYVWDLTRMNSADPIRLKIPGGTNYLAFSSDANLLAAGSDALYLSMWTISDWKQVFLLHKHVGVRSVYGFHPTRGDLAFDGSSGVIRILPAYPKSGNSPPYGRLSGVEPHFEDEQNGLQVAAVRAQHLIKPSNCAQ